MLDLAPQFICASDALQDGGVGVRFDVLYRGREIGAFSIRHEGMAYAYLNQCAHIPMELDWLAGHFFDDSCTWLVCATHGALYEPHTGQCVGGPCRGAKLVALTVQELQGEVCWIPDGHFQPAPSTSSPPEST
jgi:nitrite reductase/ring-hydroxylating ferredoxin subunit